MKKKDCSVIQKCKKASLATLWCAASTGDNDVKWLSITGHVMNKHENPLFRKNGLTKMFLRTVELKVFVFVSQALIRVINNKHSKVNTI